MQKPPATLPPQPEPERRADVIVSGSLARCPYCHEDVSQGEAWVACAECLARHHTECWDEGTKCSSCGNTDRLTREGEGAPASRYPRLVALGHSELPGRRRLLRRPLSTTFRSTFSGELNPAGESPWLAAEVRRGLKTKGNCQVSPTEVQWRPNDQGCRSLSAKIATRNGQTTVEVQENFGPLVGLLGGLGLGGGLGTLAPALTILIDVLGLEASYGWLAPVLMGVAAAIMIPLLILAFQRIVDKRRVQLESFNQRLANRLSAPVPTRSGPENRPNPLKD